MAAHATAAHDAVGRFSGVLWGEGGNWISSFGYPIGLQVVALARGVAWLHLGRHDNTPGEFLDTTLTEIGKCSLLRQCYPTFQETGFPNPVRITRIPSNVRYRGGLEGSKPHPKIYDWLVIVGV